MYWYFSACKEIAMLDIQILMVSVLDLEYMVCEHIVEDKNKKPKRFKLYPKKVTATLTMKIDKINHKIGIKIIQFGVNSNKATTGHKLQGASLN